ncbi:Long chain base biosynthesis protein 1, partial [Linum perenne]
PSWYSAAGPHTVINGKEVVNFATADYLGLTGHEKLLESCTNAMDKYGVGSCGPHVHLDCETRIANFLGTPDSILYSYGLSTMFSAIPCFCKKGDIIVKITTDKKGAKKRRYIVVESVYQNSGQIAPLDEIIRLKEKYLFRVLLDESNSFGVLGKSGKGLTEHCGVPKIDIITAAMGHALATEGGFCTGSARRMSSSGYVFSASLPPYLASAAITAIEMIEDNPGLITKLKENISFLLKELSGLEGLTVTSNPESPIVYLKLERSTGSKAGDMELLEKITDLALKEDSIFIVTSKRSTLDKCPLPVGIRMFVSAGHSETDLRKASECLKRVSALVIKNRD